MISEFQVAILIDDIKSAKTLSDCFRAMGIYAHYYEDINDLWLALNESTPDMCIVDVALMASSEIQFKNHPKISTNEIEYSFFYEESSQFLLKSVAGLNHIGLLHKEADLDEQVKTLIGRKNKQTRMNLENEELKQRIERLKLRSSRLTSAQDDIELRIEQEDKLNSLIQGFGTVDTPREFLKRVVSSLSAFDDCEQFGIYHLNESGDKLISPIASKEKYIQLPELRLSTKCTRGIDQYAQDMGHDICYNKIEKELTLIQILGVNDAPDIILYGVFSHEKLNGFNWEQFETKLSSEYRKSLINLVNNQKSINTSEDSFSILQYMDNIQYHKVKSDYKFALVSFIGITSELRKNLENRFNWSTFQTEFYQDLKSMLNENFKVSSITPSDFVICLDRQEVDTEYQKLKAIVSEFENVEVL